MVAFFSVTIPFHGLRGFTIIEALLAITVIALVSGITIPMYLNYQINNDLRLAMEQTTQGLRRAQTLSQAGDGDSLWGYHVPTGTLYKGASYALRDASADEVYPMPSSITVSGSILEVAYSRQGSPDRTGIITLTDVTGKNLQVRIYVPEIGIPVNITDTMAICHYPPGGGEPKTLNVSENAWPAHQQAHGDIIGPCP